MQEAEKKSIEEKETTSSSAVHSKSAPTLRISTLLSAPHSLPSQKKKGSVLGTHINEIQLQFHTLIDRIFLHDPELRRTRMVEYLLDIIQRKASKHRESSVQRDRLCTYERARAKWEYHRRQASECHHRHAGKERAAEVKVFILSLSALSQKGRGRSDHRPLSLSRQPN